MIDDLLVELLRLSQGNATDVVEVLRRAKVLAAQLGDEGARSWIDLELKGYPPGVDVPKYRVIPSELQVRNPFHGWNAVAWSGPGNLQEHFAHADVTSTMSEIVEICRGDGQPRASLGQAEMDVLVPTNPEFARLPTARWFAKSSFVAIADSARDRVLDWAIEVQTKRKLEQQPKESRVTRTKRTMFIGSTVEALKVARAVQAELDHDLEITLWNQNLFEPGNATWIDLVGQARGQKFDLALLVLGAEDQITSRGATANAPRDNCLLELGLFAGALGPDRTFFLIDRDNKPKIASDLLGITGLTYGGNRQDGNLQSAVGPACEQIRQRAEKLYAK